VKDGEARDQRRAGWAGYLDQFHTNRPGVTEAVLVRCNDAGFQTPYEWLVEGLDHEARVLDVACGSGPTAPLLGRRWLGVDRSTAELRTAIAHDRQAVVQGDATQLPIRSGSVDIVIFSMSLMLIDPTAALAAARRVLTPDGEIRALLATRSPLTALDRWRYLRLFAMVRAVPRFPPTPLRHESTETFAGAGLHVLSDLQRRFTFSIDTPADTRLLVSSWYQPDTASDRDMPTGRPLGFESIGVPLRRIIARPAV
jgi:SAM-dependent methyltransferase